jgi:hypothetical protein
MEAVYTYEGTDAIQSLIVGREITGIGAFGQDFPGSGARGRASMNRGGWVGERHVWPVSSGVSAGPVG